MKSDRTLVNEAGSIPQPRGNKRLVWWHGVCSPLSYSLGPRCRAGTTSVDRRAGAKEKFQGGAWLYPCVKVREQARRFLCHRRPRFFLWSVARIPEHASAPALRRDGRSPRSTTPSAGIPTSSVFSDSPDRAMTAPPRAPAPRRSTRSSRRSQTSAPSSTPASCSTWAPRAYHS